MTRNLQIMTSSIYWSHKVLLRYSLEELSMSSVLPISPTLPLSPLPPVALLPVLTPINSSKISTRPAYQRNLNSYLDFIWQNYFADLSHVNEVQIAYCRPWKTRLGLIRMSLDNAISFIGINSLLRSAQVPECVLLTTIAHELVHYTHGFGSPLPRLYEHPHANRVVEKELERRGLGSVLHECDTWIEEQWFEYYADYYAQRKSGF